MMKKLSHIISFVSGLSLLFSCSYDDSLLREEIGKVDAELSGYEQTMTDLEDQMSSLTELINSTFVSYIGTDEEGNQVISYMEDGGEVKTLTKRLDAALKRNAVYTVTVSKDHIDIVVKPVFEEWEPGDNIEITPSVG